MTKTYYDLNLPVVAELSLEVKSRDRIALIGPSGSGKSTVLNLVAGLELPTSGTITWPALSPPLAPTQIGFALQGPSLIPWLSVLENVALPLQLMDATDWLHRVGHCLTLLGLTDVEDKLPEEISGGQAQRVVLARAMVSEPKVLLADEPTGQLDHQSAELVMSALLAWADRTGCALIVATHDPQIAKRLQTVWSINHGQLRPVSP